MDDYKLISMKNIQLVRGLLRDPKKQNHKGLKPKLDNIILMWKGVGQ